MSQIDSSTGIDNASSDKEALKHKAVAAKDAVADLAGEAKRYASHRVDDLKGTASDWTASAKDKIGDANDQMVDYVQRYPFKSLAIAVGIGFVAGLILKRR